MTTKEKLLEEIDSLSSNMVEDVYQFIHSLKVKKKTTNQFRSFNLKGQFDTVDVREKAYE